MCQKLCPCPNDDVKYPRFVFQTMRLIKAGKSGSEVAAHLGMTYKAFMVRLNMVRKEIIDNEIGLSQRDQSSALRMLRFRNPRPQGVRPNPKVLDKKFILKNAILLHK